jgi:Universal stress protein family
VAPIWIVGVDGSELSLAGLATAAALACRAGAEILVVHVRHVPATCVEYPSALGVARPAMLEQQDAARAGARSVLAGADVNWRFDVRVGNPADELIAAAREAHASSPSAVTATRASATSCSDRWRCDCSSTPRPTSSSCADGRSPSRGKLLGDDFTIELQAVEPCIDPPPDTPNIADIVLRSRRR